MVEDDFILLEAKEFDLEISWLNDEDFEVEVVWTLGSGGGGTAQIQSDWNQTDTGAADFIKNKPAIPDELADLSDDSDHRTVSDTEKSTWNGKADANHNHSGVYQPVGSYELNSNKNQPSGYAGLDESGLVPASLLPSYVDDIIEVADFDSLPETGESGKIYVTLDDNKTYRWAGTAYVEITASPGSTDAVAEGSTNQYFTEARVRATVLTGLTAAAQRAALEATDSILTAFSKVKKYLADLGDAAFKNVGSGATDVAAGDHNHAGSYEPAGSRTTHESTYEHYLPFAVWKPAITVTRSSDTAASYTAASAALATIMANAISNRLLRWTSSDGNTVKRGFVVNATANSTTVTINLNGDAFAAGDTNFRIAYRGFEIQRLKVTVPGELTADSAANVGSKIISFQIKIGDV